MTKRSPIESDEAAASRLLAGRWWFLKDFDAFKADPVAQGYEVIIRHPGFASNAMAMVMRLTDCPPWPNITEAIRDDFYFNFSSDLRRLGLLRPLTIFPSGAIFNCCDGYQLVLVSLRRELSRMEAKQAASFGSFLPSASYRTQQKGRRDLLSWRACRHPDRVELDWSRLVHALKQRTVAGESWPGFREDIWASVRTLLTRDPDFRSHRRNVIANQKTKRPKLFDARALALACAAHDWRTAGRSFPALWRLIRGAIHERLDKRAKQARWDNALNEMGRLLDRVRLPLPASLRASPRLKRSFFGHEDRHS